MLEATRLTLSDDTMHQRSTVGKILVWMQEHPNLCKNTNAAAMAKTMNSAGVGRFDSLRQVVQRMVNNQILYRYGNKKRSNFHINYMHKDIPPYVLENAPESDRKFREIAEGGLKDGQYIDDVGCVVTKNKKAHEPKEEVTKKPEQKPEGEKEEKSEERPELDEIVEHFTAVPVMVRKDKSNGSMNISITLNLNLNN